MGSLYNNNANLKASGVPVQYTPEQIQEYIKCKEEKSQKYKIPDKPTRSNINAFRSTRWIGCFTRRSWWMWTV